MSRLLVTADTNILASGLVRLRANPDAAPAQFLRTWQAGRCWLLGKDRRRRSAGR